MPRESPARDYFAKAVGQGPIMMLIRWIEEEQAAGVVRADFDARMIAMTITSLSAFPFLMLPVVGAEIGLEIDDDFPNRLIEHNQRFLALGLRARSEEER